MKEVNKAKADDTTSSRDFGKLGAHPLLGRDFVPVDVNTAGGISDVRASNFLSAIKAVVGCPMKRTVINFENSADIQKRRRGMDTDEGLFTNKDRFFSRSSCSSREISLHDSANSKRSTFKGEATPTRHDKVTDGEGEHDVQCLVEFELPHHMRAEHDCRVDVRQGDGSQHDTCVSVLEEELPCNSGDVPTRNDATPVIGENAALHPTNVFPQPISLDRSKAQRRAMESDRYSHNYVGLDRLYEHRAKQRKLCKLILDEGGLSCKVTNPDMVMIKCGGMEATLSIVATVVSPVAPLHEQYVCVAALLYSKMWNDRRVGRGKKLMFGPHFSRGVLQGDGLEESMRCDAAKFIIDNLQPVKRLNMLVVLVSAGTKWWCIVLSFTRREVLVVDGAEIDNAAGAHHADVLKLIEFLEGVMQLVDKNWSPGDLFDWNISSQCVAHRFTWQGHSTGVHMLLAAKRSCDSFSYYCDNSSFTEDRVRLLYDDISSEHNEHREAVMSLLAST